MDVSACWGMNTLGWSTGGLDDGEMGWLVERMLDVFMRSRSYAGQLAVEWDGGRKCDFVPLILDTTPSTRPYFQKQKQYPKHTMAIPQFWLNFPFLLEEHGMSKMIIR